VHALFDALCFSLEFPIITRIRFHNTLKFEMKKSEVRKSGGFR
jgi:hypothetical protein